MKQCFKCQEVKPLGDFYKHSQMSDGHLNKCKECTKKDVDQHRQLNIEKIRAYDRARGSRQGPEYSLEYRRRFPLKVKAQKMVGNYIRDKKLFREPCEQCGNPRSCAHHDDYAKPLNVRWLCHACHSQWHAKHGEGKNAA